MTNIMIHQGTTIILVESKIAHPFPQEKETASPYGCENVIALIYFKINKELYRLPANNTSTHFIFWFFINSGQPYHDGSRTSFIISIIFTI